ncbi:MAG TPA: MFS transporter [Iamia sp.]|nr:MFS transporter [Iamia sp.]
MAGVTATSFAVTLGVGIIFPLMPIFARDLGVSLTAMGTLVGAFGLARIAVDLVGGAIVTRFGERTIAAGGGLTVAAGSLLTAYAGDFTGLLVARVVHGLGVALFVLASLVFIGRAAPSSHRGRLNGLLQAAMLLSTSVGPVIGAVLASIGGVRLPFLIAAAIGGAATIYAGRVFPSTATVAGPAVAVVGQEVRRRWRWTLAVAVFASFATWAMRSAVRFTLTPVLVTEGMGADLMWSGVVLAVMSVGDIAGLAVGGRQMDRLGRRTVLVAGFALTAGSVAVFPLAGAVPALLVVATVFGLVGGFCAVVPATMAADLAGGRASVVAGARLAGDVGVLVGPMASGAVLDGGGYGAGYGVVAGLCALTAVAGLTGRETRDA